MYGLQGKLTAQDGKRAAFIKILTQAAELVGQDPACRAYILSEDATNETVIWVFEIWDNKTAHDASLQDLRIRALISEAMPLLASAPEGVELKIAGGYGIQKS